MFLRSWRASIAQLVEQLICNQWVGSSSPAVHWWHKLSIYLDFNHSSNSCPYFWYFESGGKILVAKGQ